ncbi:MAG TPA: hypothetical protein PKD53_17795 [Chloroflexaceae bacterium]|nr:hypothetical protein [Chloroflexaceae bacterium]
MSGRDPYEERERRRDDWDAERRRDEAELDRRSANPMLRAALITVAVLVALLFLGMLGRAFGLFPRGPGAATVPTRELLLDDPTAGPILGGAPPPDLAATVPPVGVPPTPPPEVSPTFNGFYDLRGGMRALGMPLTPPQSVNGREIQWFERARVEHWPEHAGTPYEVQLGRLGVEFTQGREFARQGYFVSTPELRYFPETGHAVGGAFLRYWEQNGGLDAFGLPISEEFDEVLHDGMTYRVQYFERVRMEYHPEHAGTPDEVQLGRLGAALLHNEARPDTIQPVPTPVPLP